MRGKHRKHSNQINCLMSYLAATTRLSCPLPALWHARRGCGLGCVAAAASVASVASAPSGDGPGVLLFQGDLHHHVIRTGTPQPSRLLILPSSQHPQAPCLL